MQPSQQTPVNQPTATDLVDKAAAMMETLREQGKTI